MEKRNKKKTIKKRRREYISKRSKETKLRIVEARKDDKFMFPEDKLDLEIFLE